MGCSLSDYISSLDHSTEGQLWPTVLIIEKFGLHILAHSCNSTCDLMVLKHKIIQQGGMCHTKCILVKEIGRKERQRKRKENLREGERYSSNFF